MSANNDLQQKLRAGVEAAKNGDRPTARKLLEQVLAVDNKNEMAWMWLASVVNTLPERRACLEQVLQINPRNQRAQEALRRLGDAKAPKGDDQRTRQTIDRLRGTSSTAQAAARRGGAGAITAPELSSSTLIIGGLVLSVVLIALVLLSAANNPNPPGSSTAAPTALVFVASFTPTITETPTPTATSTPVTPVNLGELTRQVATLPPTFTPTATFTPTNTYTPSPEPPGLETFNVIYASLNSGAEQPDMYIMNGDGTGESLFADGGRDVVYDPSGSRIAFVRDVNVNGQIAAEIFIAPADNPGAAQQLTELGIADTSHPSWSPDGAKIVFSSSNQSTKSELWVIEVQNERLTRLTQNEAIDREPSWSPTANIIVFTSDLESPDAPEVYSMTLNGAADAVVSVSRLTNANRNSYSPAWSPDGQLITFISDRNGDGDVFTMDAQGQNELVLTQDDAGAEDRNPTFSPDGRWIFFLSNRNTDNFQIFALRTDGSTSFQVLDNGRNDQSVAFRP